MFHLITEEFHGSQISFRKEDAWVNLTQMCAAFEKRPGDFLDLPGTKKYIEALEKDSINLRTNPGIQLPENLVIRFVETRTGRHASGTWAHPYVGLECARWLSPELSIQCNRIILRLLSGETVKGMELNPTQRRLRKQRLKLHGSELRAEIENVRRQLDALLMSEELEGHVPICEWLGAGGHGLSQGERTQLGVLLARQARRGEITSGEKTIPVNNKSRVRRTVTYTPEAISAAFTALFPQQIAFD